MKITKFQAGVFLVVLSAISFFLFVVWPKIYVGSDFYAFGVYITHGITGVAGGCWVYEDLD